MDKRLNLMDKRLKLIYKKGKCTTSFPSLSLPLFQINKKRRQKLQDTVWPFGLFKIIHISFDNLEQTIKIWFKCKIEPHILEQSFFFTNFGFICLYINVVFNCQNFDILKMFIAKFGHFFTLQPCLKVRAADLITKHWVSYIFQL